ncbi:hypothetical protein C6501_15530 [Candidatus Poribacteria bacterium]|nr:MAG: hypothetical protein C6501_15530 [Candidatus Poribacteria bacterium]
MKHNDTVLIQQILSGNDDAFSTLVRKYQKQVHALAWQIIGDFHIAEEITQDAFLKAYMELKNLKEPQRFAGWLSVITRRRCFAWLRKKRMCTQSLEHLEESDSEQIEEAAYSEYVVEEKERTAAETQRDVVKKLLAKLQESERTVMTLHYFGEMTCAEIGEFLGVSANTIKSRLRRAQQRLQKHEPIIREALEHFKITPNLTDNIMREVSQTKPATPPASKPFVPWLFAASTVVVVLLMLGIGNSKYLTRFQQPYNFDADSEVKIDIVEAPIMANLALKPNLQKQLGSVNAENNDPIPEQQPKENLPLSKRTQEDGTFKHYSQWNLPKHAKARLGKGRITTMQFSPDGNQLALGSPIGIWLYDANTGKEFHLFPGPCGSLAFSPDGRYLVNGGGTRFYGGEFHVWDTTTFQRVQLDKTPPETVALRFDEDGKTLVSIESGQYKQSTIHSISTINLDTKHVEVKDAKKKFGPPLESGMLYTLLQDKIAIARDLREQKQIEIWDIETEKEIFTFNLKEPEDNMVGIGNFIRVITFSTDGRLLASGSQNSQIRLWDASTGEHLHTFQKRQEDMNDRNKTLQLVFSPNNKILACGNEDTTVQVWDVTTRDSLAVFEAHIGETTALAFSSDSSTLATASSDGTVLLWDIKTGDPLPMQITGHPSGVYTTAFSQDSSTLTSIASNIRPTSWDLTTLQKPNLNSESKFRIEGRRIGEGWSSFYAFSPDATKLASIHGNQVRLTDVQTGQELKIYYCTQKGSSSLAQKIIFSPDGKNIAVGANGIIHLWNLENDKYKKIYLLDPIKNRRIFDLIYPRPLDVTRLVFSPNGEIIVSGTEGGKVQMWHAETGTELCTLLEGEWFEEARKKKDGNIRKIRTKKHITGLVFSPDRDMLAVTLLFGKTYFFKCADQTQIEDIKVKRCDTLAFSPDDTLLISGLTAGKIELWDLTTREKLTTLDGHRNGLFQLAFSPDGKTMASRGGEGTILVWDWKEIRKSSPKEKNPLEQFKEKLNAITLASSERGLFAQVAEDIKNTKDKESYVDMLNQIIQDMSNKLSVQLNASLVLAEFYRENDMLEKAEELIQKTGFITEDKWLILGPFDNSNGSGYDKAFIPEDAAQVDTTAKYDSFNGKVSWQKCTDDTLNGYIHLGKDLDWCVAYAFATITSPDQREVQFRFDSDDQGKTWLNGVEVFAHTKSHSAAIDRYIIPVTLKQGKNSILVKVCDEEEGWGFYLRITDQNGQVFDDLKINRNVQN